MESKIWGREPALVIAGIQAAIVLGVSFGLQLSMEQTAAILAFSAAILGLVTRSKVRSVDTINREESA